MKKICFVGGGNMASAMLAGLIKKHPKLACHIIEPFAPAREKLSTLNVVVHEAANRAAIDGSDAVVLAVKPQVLKDVCEILPTSAWRADREYRGGDARRHHRALARWTCANRAHDAEHACAHRTEGITGLYAASTAADDVATATELMRSTGPVGACGERGHD